MGDGLNGVQIIHQSLSYILAIKRCSVLPAKLSEELN